MINNFHWVCPYCNRDATIGASNYSEETHFFHLGNKTGNQLGLTTEVVCCPNPECQDYVISAKLRDTTTNLNQIFPTDSPLIKWKLKPQSSAKPFPDFIPEAIRQDYEEACLIKNLSPKASATLSRRCLQGMIRDFWKITNKKNLFEEISSIKDNVDPLVWKAIDGVRGIGNIGAHMEKNIDLIIEVDSQEASKLIALIELLLGEWYIARHERENKLQSIIGIADNKKVQKKEKKGLAIKK